MTLLKTGRIIIWTLSLAIVAVSMAVYPFFYFRQATLKAEMQNVIRTGSYKHFTTFRFSEGELKKMEWLDGGKEFNYNGELYDIIKKDKTGDVITVIALSDKKEKQLVQLMELQEQKMPLSKKSLVFVFQLLSQALPSGEKPILTLTEENVSYFSSCQAQYASPSVIIYTPPPEC